jgi:hypothetical protein
MKRIRWSIVSLAFVLAALICLSTVDRIPFGPKMARAQAPLLTDGNFEKDLASKDLRAKKPGQGWYESRIDGKLGPKLLKLSKKPVAGNATKKALIKGNAKKNTYLTQAFSQPQKGQFTIKYDILVSKIFPSPNRGAIQMIGNVIPGKAPNGTGAQRFVFLAFENATAAGKLNLIAYEGGSPQAANKKTMVAPNLDPKKWYTVTLNVNVATKAYTVSVAGVTTAPVALKAFDANGKGAPGALTHLSFASWNDGPGTFYVDNVGQ